MKIRATALLLLAHWVCAASPAEDITGSWILESGKNKNYFDVEIVAATDATEGYWLVNTEGTPLIYEGRYLLQNTRLVRVQTGPKEYEGIAFRAEGSRWVWAGDRKNNRLTAYAGSVLRRPEPMAPGALFNELGQGNLYVAALNNDKGEIVRLLNTGSNVNSANQDKRRRTALYAAIDMGHIELTALLLDKGADVNYKDSSGITPLMAAGQSSGPYAALIRLLLGKGADASIKDKQGLTALDRLEKAAATGFKDTLVKELAAAAKG